jgi:hypothetical protein
LATYKGPTSDISLPGDSFTLRYGITPAPRVWYAVLRLPRLFMLVRGMTKLLAFEAAYLPRILSLLARVLVTAAVIEVDFFAGMASSANGFF